MRIFAAENLHKSQKRTNASIFWHKKMEAFGTRYAILCIIFAVRIYIYTENNICRLANMCICWTHVCTYVHTYVVSSNVYGREYPSERFNFSMISSPSTIDAPLRAEKNAHVHTIYRSHTYVPICVIVYVQTRHSNSRFSRKILPTMNN